MTQIILIVLPVFGLIVLGWLAGISGYLSDRVGEGLSDFVFCVAVPCLLFRTMATAALPDTSPWSYWLAYFLGVAAIWILADLLARRRGRSPAAASILGFATAQSNTVLLGIPLILVAYGEAARVPVFVLVAVHLSAMMTAVTVLVAVANRTADASAGLPARLAELLRSLILHPILLGIGLGLLYRWSGLPLSGASLTLVDMLSSAAVPCALFSMGLALKRYGIHGNLAFLAIIAGLKLILHPLLVFALVNYAITLPALWGKTAVLFAACPCGINGYLIAGRYKLEEATTSGAIAVTTILSIFTIAGWLWVLG